MTSAQVLRTTVFALSFAVPAAAATDRFGGAFKGSTSNTGSLLWFVVAIVAAIAAASLLAHLATRLQKRKIAATRRKEDRKAVQNFKEQAAAQGFEFSESRTLENLALRLEPRDPESLLNTSEGRERLMVDIKQRWRRRQREIKMLANIEKKLQRVGEGHLHQREFVRASVNMPLWVAPENPSILPPVPTDEETDDLLAENGSVRGQLLDLSEGGASIEVELDLGRDEILRFWSAEHDLWFPETEANIVDVERSMGKSILHLRFVRPPSEELLELLPVE